MRAATQLLQHVGEDINDRRTEATPDQIECTKLVPAIIRVVENCVDKGKHEIARTALETIHDLAEGESPFVLSLWEPLAQMSMNILGRKDCDTGLRSMACELLRELVSQQPGEFLRKRLVRSVLENAIRIMGQFELPERPTRDDLLEAIEVYSSNGKAVDEYSVSSAASIVDTLSIHIPERIIFPLLMSAASACLKHARWQMRATGCILVA